MHGFRIALRLRPVWRERRSEANPSSPIAQSDG